MGKKDLYAITDVSDGARTKFCVMKYRDDTYMPDFSTPYIVSRVSMHMECDCPAGNKPACRHREMVLIFEDAGEIGGVKLYSYDKKKWIVPDDIKL